MQGSEITGIILAGGKSKRFGQNKAFFELEGIRLIDRVMATMAEISSSVLISTGDDTLPMEGVHQVRDLEPGKGPLMGIYSALRQSPTDHTFVLSVDTPFVPPALFRFLYSRKGSSRVVVPVYTNGFSEPLIGYYHKDILSVMEQVLATNDLKMTNFFAAVPFLGINLERDWPDWSAKYVLNLNTREDLQSFYTAGLTP